MKKICLFFFCLLSATLAHAGSCGSISDLEKSKAKLFKNFEKCNAISVVSVHSVSVAGFSVYEKASVDEEKKAQKKACFNDWFAESAEIEVCVKNVDSAYTLYSADEDLTFLYALSRYDPQAFDLILNKLKNYDSVKTEKNRFFILGDGDYKAETRILRSLSTEETTTNLMQYQASREDQDLLVLYLQFLKTKYDGQYAYDRASRLMWHFAVTNYSYIDTDREAFKKKYADGTYNSFLDENVSSALIAKFLDGRRLIIRREKLRRKLKDKTKLISGSVGLITGTQLVFGNDQVEAPFFGELFLEGRFWRFSVRLSGFMGLDEHDEGIAESEEGPMLAGGFAVINGENWTLDLFAGVHWLALNSKVRGRQTANDRFLFGVQVDRRFHITDLTDVFIRGQISMINIAFYYDEKAGNGESDLKSFCDPGFNFGLGFGFTFGKPKPRSWIASEEELAEAGLK